PGRIPGRDNGIESRTVRPDAVPTIGNISICFGVMEYFIVALAGSSSEGEGLMSMISLIPFGSSANDNTEFIPACTIKEVTRIVANPCISIRTVYVPGGRKGT